jgi:hypothetical protein
MEILTDKKVEIVEDLLELPQDQKFMVVHCTLPPPRCMIRIWSSTYLIDTASGARAPLTHAIGIVMYPQWQRVKSSYTTYHFTLIFELLPDSDAPFYLLEDIPESNGFYSPVLKRNSNEIYHTIILTL